MKRASLALAVGLFCGCAAAVARPASVKFRELKNGGFAASSSATPQILVATTADTYRRIWDAVIRSGVAPDVDFAQESVIFLTDRQRNTGGYSLEPKSVEIDGTTATVAVHVHAPGRGAITTQVITTPFAVIAVRSRAIETARWTDAATGNVVASTPEQP